MAKRSSAVSKVIASIPSPPGSAVESGAIGPGPLPLPDLTGITRSEDLSLAEKRKQVLAALGMRKKKQIYATPEDRKAASKARRDKRKADRVETLKKYGLEPRARGPKKTEAERKQARSDRGKRRRAALREMAKLHPDVAARYGIDPSRFRL